INTIVEMRGNDKITSAITRLSSDFVLWRIAIHFPMRLCGRGIWLCGRTRSRKQSWTTLGQKNGFQFGNVYEQNMKSPMSPTLTRTQVSSDLCWRKHGRTVRNFLVWTASASQFLNLQRHITRTETAVKVVTKAARASETPQPTRTLWAARSL